MQVDGQCLCGGIRFLAQINPDSVTLCHCSDCQVHSGTAFGLVAGVVDGQFELLSGELKFYTKTAESGRKRDLAFCPDCGTRIYACTKGDPNAFFGLRLGAVRQRAELVPRGQVWCRSALPWVSGLADIPGNLTQGG